MHVQRSSLLLAIAIFAGALVTACGRGAAPDPTATPAAEPSTAAVEPTATEPTTEPATEAETPSVQREFDRTELLRQLAQNVIVPVHGAFVERAAELAAAAEAFDAEPSADTLATLQEAWRAAADAWKACEIFSFRETMILHNQIDKWPTKPSLIEGFIADNERIDEPFVDGIGSTSRGLPALEYLIFDPEAGDEAVLAALTTAERSSQRRQYAVALSQNLHGKGEELLDIWTVDVGTGSGSLVDSFVAAGGEGGNVQGSLNMLANEMMALLEHVAHTRLGDPLGKSTFGEPVPHLAEAYRSEHSLSLVVRSLHGIQKTFNGAAGLGFDDYLNFVGASYKDQSLSQAVNAQFDAAFAALDAVPPPLSTAVVNDPEAVDAAYEAIRALIVLLKADMANHLGVTITFSDNDGD